MAEEQKPEGKEPDTGDEAANVNENGTGSDEGTTPPAQPTMDTSAFDARMDALEQQVSAIAEALTTMSVVSEDGNDGDPGGSDVDSEYGEALELDDVERMLGL